MMKRLLIATTPPEERRRLGLFSFCCPGKDSAPAAVQEAPTPQQQHEKKMDEITSAEIRANEKKLKEALRKRHAGEIVKLEVIQEGDEGVCDIFDNLDHVRIDMGLMDRGNIKNSDVKSTIANYVPGNVEVLTENDKMILLLKEISRRRRLASDAFLEHVADVQKVVDDGSLKDGLLDAHDDLCDLGYVRFCPCR